MRTIIASWIMALALVQGLWAQEERPVEDILKERIVALSDEKERLDELIDAAETKEEKQELKEQRRDVVRKLNTQQDKLNRLTDPSYGWNRSAVNRPWLYDPFLYGRLGYRSYYFNRFPRYYYVRPVVVVRGRT